MKIPAPAPHRRQPPLPRRDLPQIEFADQLTVAATTAVPKADRSLCWLLACAGWGTVAAARSFAEKAVEADGGAVEKR